MREAPLGPLIDLTVNGLLNELGSGNPTPGSGSAAALQAIVCGRLVQSAVAITSKPKFKPRYDDVLVTLENWSLEIENRIVPELKRLFQQDSDQFDIYIECYKRWEKAGSPVGQNKLNLERLEKLRPATDNALAIGKLSAELAKAAALVFDHGFADVRGDSAVALHSAVASVGGCMAIVELNLIPFDWNDWVFQVRGELSQLKSAHHDLSEKAIKCVEKLEAENSLKRTLAFEQILAEYRSGNKEEVTNSEAAIEQLARDIQNTLWVNRDLFWTEEKPGNYLDILKPEIAIEKLLGYHFAYASLGRFIDEDGREYEVAGEIDKGKRIVRVSREMRRPIQNFTAAHELGHALLHKGLEFHRDRPIDGTTTGKDVLERQADKFAAFFLMPSKQVRAVFLELFSMDRFEINDDNVFNLRQGRVSAFRSEVRDINGLAKHIAASEYFQGRSFRSLADVFGVSTGAMAYRLKELDLVRF